MLCIKDGFSYSTFSFTWTFLQKRAKQGLNSRATDDDPYNFVVDSIKTYIRVPVPIPGFKEASTNHL